MLYKITNKTKNILISPKAKIADDFFKRLIGLMFKKFMDKEEVLIFKHASSIHTCFMRFPIDIVFLNKEMRIIRICKAVKPWRAVFCPGSLFTLEFPSPAACGKSLELGNILELSPLLR
ncbi:MAG: DUF192 domain-containing protein [Candidatus Omnitrophica bacterium]|jgi:uncharacterized membrane protein (UPF0127 family)|nr:DUF192 domain-containing protein [Candidatus Omnitrophota bacterium]